MAKLLFKHSESAYGKFRVFIQDTTSAVGAGLTGLTFSTTGLAVHTIADNEASVTSYTAAGSTIETITTLGTFAAPTATKCRFKEIDSTNLPGWYEVQIADARWAVASSRAVQVNVIVTGGFCAPVEIQLSLFDVNSATVTPGAGSITAAAIADGAIDRATFAADTGLQSIRSNTAQSATATTIVLDASASAVDDFYNSCIIYITGGTGVGQARAVSDYVGATKTATVSTWGTNPDATSTFAILPDSASSGSGGATAADVWAYATRTLTGGAAVTVVAPVVSASEIQMLAGYDYNDLADQALTWSFTDAPDLTGATVDIVKVDTSETSYGFTVTVSGAGTATQTVKAEVTSAMTLALATAGTKVALAFRIKATLSNTAQLVLAEGIMTIR